MKIQKFLKILILSTSLVFVSCSSDTPKETVYINASDLQKETLAVDGMTCLGCEVTLEKSISKIKGIASVKASSSRNNVIVEFDKSRTNTKEVVEAIKTSGYKVKE